LPLDEEDTVADIDVQRKSGSPVWLWVAGLVVLALAIWAIAGMMGRDDVAVAPATDPTQMEPAPGLPQQDPTGMEALPAAARTFMNDCHLAEGVRTEEMGPAHDFTVNCFEHLASSIEGFARERGAEPAIEEQARMIRERVQQLRQSDPASLQHSNLARQAADAGADAFAAMHPRWHAGDAEIQGNVLEVQQAAQRIDPGEPLLDQLTDLRSYFRRAGDTMNVMVRNLPIAR
jgi:hypothetical protein